VRWCGLDLYDSGWGVVAGSSECDNKPLIFEALPAERCRDNIKMFKLNQANLRKIF
jgi:hypothetical protein